MEKQTTPITPASIKFHNKNLKISPRKLRLWAGDIKKYTPPEALSRLKLVNTNGAKILVKALQNVISDAKNNFNIDPSRLQFSEVRIDEGLKIKRMDKSHGSRFARGLIQKRHSRLTIILSVSSDTIPEVKKEIVEVKKTTKPKSSDKKNGSKS